MRGIRGRGGFSLLQLLLVTAIVGALLGVAGGGFADLVKRQRALQALATFQSLFHFARSRAVYTGSATTVCAVNAAGECIRTWGDDNAIVVFHDSDRDRRLDTSETVLRNLRWPNAKGFIRWRASLGRTYVTFLAAGNTWQNGTLYYCPRDRDRQHSTALVVSHSGRAYVPGDSDKDGIQEDRYGDNLRCDA